MAFVPTTPTALVSSLNHICGAAPAVNTHVSSASQSRAPRVARFSMMADRKFLVGGNWKCNLTKDAINDLISAFNNGPEIDTSSVEVVVAPPSVYLESTRTALRSDFSVSSQNTWISAGGAFTGELDAKMIADIGADWAILGHSERRHHPIIKEADDVVAQKAGYALSEAGLKVIYCIGELLEQRESGQTVAVCERQLAALANVVSDWSNIVIAYEPVWAIGTGKVATPDQAEEVHSAVRKWLAANVSQAVADSTRILYGGSVSPKNCQELAKEPNVDGFLVGGASLKPAFLDIVDSYKVTLAGAV